MISRRSLLAMVGLLPFIPKIPESKIPESKKPVIFDGAFRLKVDRHAYPQLHLHLRLDGEWCLMVDRNVPPGEEVHCWYVKDDELKCHVSRHTKKLSVGDLVPIDKDLIDDIFNIV